MPIDFQVTLSVCCHPKLLLPWQFQTARVTISTTQKAIHRVHKWRTRGKKLVPSHESEALQDKREIFSLQQSVYTQNISQVITSKNN